MNGISLDELVTFPLHVSSAIKAIFISNDYHAIQMMLHSSRLKEIEKGWSRHRMETCRILACYGLELNTTGKILKLTKQQELDLSGSSFAISPEVLVYLFGPFNRLLVDGGANSAAHVNVTVSQSVVPTIKVEIRIPNSLKQSWQMVQSLMASNKMQTI